MSISLFRNGHADRAAQPRLTVLLVVPERTGSPTPLAVKAVLILVGINLLVAAMLLLKLRAPHLG